MAEIIDLSKRITEKKEERKLYDYYDNHNYILDKCEEVFYDAIVIEVCEDGNINLSTTAMNPDDIIECLLSAAFKVKGENEKDN